MRPLRHRGGSGTTRAVKHPDAKKVTASGTFACCALPPDIVAYASRSACATGATAPGRQFAAD